MPSSEQNINLARYMIIPRTLVFIKYSNEILLIKGASDKKIWPNKYNGLGGHIEQGEDIFNAALREIKEEAGLQIDKATLSAIITINTNNNPGIGMFVFWAQVANKTTLPGKEGTLHWFSIDDLPHEELVEDLNQLIPFSLKCFQNGSVGYGLYKYTQDGLNILLRE